MIYSNSFSGLVRVHIPLRRILGLILSVLKLISLNQSLVHWVPQHRRGRIQHENQLLPQQLFTCILSLNLETKGISLKIHLLRETQVSLRRFTTGEIWSEPQRAREGTFLVQPGNLFWLIPSFIIPSQKRFHQKPGKVNSSKSNRF